MNQKEKQFLSDILDTYEEQRMDEITVETINMLNSIRRKLFQSLYKEAGN